MYDLQREDRLHASSPQLCQIRHGNPPPSSLSPSLYQHVCSATPYTPPKHMPIHKHTHINTQTQSHPSPLWTQTQLGHDITTRRPPWELGLLFFSLGQPLRPLSRSNDMVLCPVTYITLAGCHTKNTVSRLMPGLRFTGNISHIFTVRTMGNMRRIFKVKYRHFSEREDTWNLCIVVMFSLITSPFSLKWIILK